MNYYIIYSYWVLCNNIFKFEYLLKILNYLELLNESMFISSSKIYYLYWLNYYFMVGENIKA